MGIHLKNICLGTTTLITSNEEIKDITNIVKFLGNSALLIKGVTHTTEN